jgi:hypothetical protein
LVRKDWQAGRAASAKQENGISQKEDRMNIAELIEWAKGLEDEKLRLQALVCHLLRENEQLRNRNPGGNLHVGELSIAISADDKKTHPAPMSLHYDAGFTQ